MASVLMHSLRRHIAASTSKSFSSAATAGDHSGGYLLWKRLSIFVAVPSIALCMLNAYLKHQEHAHHPRPEFVKYDYLRIRTKRFPWGEGNKSLFHNPDVNALPDGYEN